MEYAKEHPEDEEIQSYAKKLNEIIKNNNLKLVQIPNSDSVSGKADKENNLDVIYIDNKHVISNLNKNNILNVLLHELRHTMENDTINSKAEELEAETSARRIAKKINPEPQWNEPIKSFLGTYSFYAEASPGTYNIPKNAGIAVWYKPKEVIEDNNTIIIRSDKLESINQGYIEDYITFGEEKDEFGNPLPVSAIRKIYDSNGNIITTQDYGEYDSENKKFNYYKIRMEQIKLENKLNGNKKFNFGIN